MKNFFVFPFLFLFFTCATVVESAHARVDHAKELLGARHARKVAVTQAEHEAVRAFVGQTVRESLPSAWKKRSSVITEAVMTESARHGMDPLFVLAVIKSESKFLPQARGRHGEIGLMQILPKTGRWVARREGLPWKGPATLKDPTQNIRIGLMYFAYLRDRYDEKSRLYLAAYNMGTGNLKRALKKKKVPKQYASRVIRNYLHYCSELESAVG